MAEPGSAPVVVLLAAAVAVVVVLLVAVRLLAQRLARARRERAEEAERARRDAAAAALADERSRIARELHDILSHSVSVMVLQAAGARQVLASDPARAEAALAQVVSVGRQSMGELRRLLGVLRDDAPQDDDGLGPQPGLADLPALVTAFRTAGLDVRTEVLGRPRPLDPSVDLSAHRIVREALTNVSKHGGPRARVLVRQEWTASELRLEVTDSDHAGRLGAGPAGPMSTGPMPTGPMSTGPMSTGPMPTAPMSTGPMSTGHGLVGLRERARAVGGRLDAGPVAGGGFRVVAVLPVTAGADPT